MSNANTPAWHAVLLAAAALSLCAVLALGLLVGVEALTRSRIEAARIDAEAAALALVLPANRHDNALLSDRIALLAPRWLGSERPLSVWRARRAGAPAALLLQAQAPDGYAGPIDLLIGIDAEGRITGVRITAHRETPGLGDAIEASRSDWVRSFEQRSLGAPPIDRWAVRRDGGDFDQFAGATITPRAVVRAVRRALQLVLRHQDRLYAAPAEGHLELHDGPENAAAATMRPQ